MRILHVIAQLPALTGSGVYFTKVITEMKKLPVTQAALYGSYPGFEWDVLEDVYPVRFEEELNFPIVGMSANAYDEDFQRAREAGMNDYIAKPVMPMILYNTLAKWIK